MALMPISLNPINRGVTRKFPSLKTSQPVSGADPNPAVAAGAKQPDGILREAIRLCVPRESAIFSAHQSVVRGNPQTAVQVVSHGRDRFAGHFRRIGFVENGKLDAVEARDPKISANPKVVVVSLENALDVVLGQALLAFPNIHAKFCGPARLRCH